MEPKELIDRYIYAATKRLPQKMKTDVAQELRSIISDMLEERCGELTAAEQDVRVVLAELGTPRELEEKYQPHASESLLSGIYFTTWRMVLKIVLACTAFGVTIAAVIDAAAEQLVWYVALGGWFVDLFFSAMLAFAFLTILFAVFQRTRVPMHDTLQALDTLPPVPEKRSEIKVSDPIGGIVLHVLFLIVFLAFPQVISMIHNGTVVPVFSAAPLQNSWPFIAGIAVAGILRESLKLLDRAYTPRLAVVCMLVDVVTVILAVIWLQQPNLLNPEFLLQAQILFHGDAFLMQFLSRIPFWFTLLFVFACALDAGTVLWRTRPNKE